jgi:hypothetical protein
VDVAIVDGARFEVGVDSLDHVADVALSLSDVDDPGVVEPASLDEREKIIVERQQDPVVRRRVRELRTVGVTETVVLACRMDSPAAASKAICNRNQIPSSQ